jgi:hypothetical protein
MSIKETVEPIKKLHDRYYSRTPVLLAKIGDSLLIVSTSVTAYGIGSEQDTIAYIALFTGTLGKILLNFAKD